MRRWTHIAAGFTGLVVTIGVTADAAREPRREAQTQTEPKKSAQPSQKTSPRDMNKTFTNPNLDVQQFIRRFEIESRDIYAQRKAIVDALAIKPGDSIADIGAGTGLFSLLFADEVGTKGKVYAVDISKPFLEHIAKEAQKRGSQKIIKTVLGTQDSPELAAASVDLAFICDVYHHFEYPDKMLASLHKALKPGGRLVVIDFDLRKDSSEFIKHHARAAKKVYFGEIKRAAFEKVETKNPPALKENFFAEFHKIEHPSKDAKP